MVHTTITSDMVKAQLADNIIAREHEIHHYQVNIDNYTAILANLSTEWPANLLQYKGLSTQQIAEQVPDADMIVVSNLIMADNLTKALKTEKIEQSKSKQVYDALISQLDPAEIEALLATAAAKFGV